MISGRLKQSGCTGVSICTNNLSFSVSYSTPLSPLILFHLGVRDIEIPSCIVMKKNSYANVG